MADIDNIPLDTEKDVPILTSYDAGLLWDPEEGAPNVDWHTFVRSHLESAEQHYEKQFDDAVDELLRAKRQTVLLAAFASRLIATALSHGFENDTVKKVEGGVQVTDPMLIDFDTFIREYQKIEGAFPIQETEGFRQWNAAENAKEVNPDDDNPETEAPSPS